MIKVRHYDPLAYCHKNRFFFFLCSKGGKIMRTTLTGTQLTDVRIKLIQ